MLWLREIALTCLVLSVSPAVVVADESDLIRSKAALVLAQVARERGKVKLVDVCYASVEKATEVSEKTGRPLVLWVGMRCEDSPAIRSALTDAIHCHVETLDGDDSARLVLGKPGARSSVKQKDLTPESASLIRKLAGLPPEPKGKK